MALIALSSKTTLVYKKQIKEVLDRDGESAGKDSILGYMTKIRISIKHPLSEEYKKFEARWAI